MANLCPGSVSATGTSPVSGEAPGSHTRMKSKQTAAHTHSHKRVLTEMQTAFDKMQIIKGRVREKGEIGFYA